MKKICYLYPYPIEDYYFNKDVGQIPVYLNKLYDCEIDFVFFDDNKIKFNDKREINYYKLNRVFRKKFLRNTRIIEILNELRMINFYIKNSNDYDVLFFYHLSFIAWFYFKISKIFNKNIKLVLKLDIDENSARRVNNKDKNIFRKYILGSLAKMCDLIICETSTVYNILNKGIYDINVSSKLIWLPNGIDVEDLHRTKLDFQKENIIITVGRIGTYQKNTEFLLDALRSLELSKWKIYIIGPIEESFNQYKEIFMNEKNENLEVHFTGGVFDRDELYEYFAKSKIFVLTSRFESYGLVLNEAFAFNNYILTTDVGAAQDIISINNDDSIGRIITTTTELTNELERYCSLNNRVDNKEFKIKNDLNWDVILDKPEIKNIFGDN